MTKDKAIAELARIWHSPHLDLSLKTGLAEAIDTLKESNLNDSLVRDDAENCKESKSKLDLIRREDAIEAVDRVDEAHMRLKGRPMLGWCTLLDEIESIPSAEPKTGHWIDEETNYLCSECHRGCWVNSDYCPWCGADMRGKTHE